MVVLMKAWWVALRAVVTSHVRVSSSGYAIPTRVAGVLLRRARADRLCVAYANARSATGCCRCATQACGADGSRRSGEDLDARAIESCRRSEPLPRRERHMASRQLSPERVPRVR